MKLNNLTSLDPDEKARGVAGLSGASDLDQIIWDEFHSSSEAVLEAEGLWSGYNAIEEEPETSPIAAELWREPKMPWSGPTEASATRSVRLAQSYFQRVVRANFGGKCALTGISTRELLTASHIAPWAEAQEHRVNPENGLLLNRLHDAAFDKCLITFDDSLRLIVGRKLRNELPQEALAQGFLKYEGQQIRAPEKHSIDLGLLRRHRKQFETADVSPSSPRRRA